MKEWEQMLIMTFTCLIVSVTLLVVAAIDSPSSFYGFFLGPLAPSHDMYPAEALWEIAIGIFALTLSVGLSILACFLYRTQKKSVSPNRLSVSEGEKTCKQ